MLKNFLRGALLAFFATFLGVFLFFTLPDLVAGNILRRPMPFWFYENEVRVPEKCMCRLYVVTWVGQWPLVCTVHDLADSCDLRFRRARCSMSARL